MRLHSRAEGPTLTGTVAPAGLSVENCPAVTLAACRAYGFPGMRAVASTLAFTDCALDGGDWCGSIRCLSSSVGLVALNSTIFLAQTSVTGGNGGGVVIPVANRPAIGGTNCTRFVTGDSAARIVAGSGPNAVSAVDLLGGTLTIDPTVTVLGANAPPIVSTGAVLRRRVAGLLGSGGPPGGMLTAALLSPRARRS